jgi:transcriptional regulator with XRE-family HTH domain
MEEQIAKRDVLTLTEIARILRCSKTHISNLLNGRIAGVPRLAHVAMGRRKVVLREWLEQWMETSKRP